MIRIAAVGDLHFGSDGQGALGSQLAPVGDQADVLLLAGDLTRVGSPEEARLLAGELREVPVPCVAVLGNHDYHAGRERTVRRELEGAGVVVLESERVELDVAGTRLAVAGTKGFGGGFAGACGSDFGEPEMKAFIRRTEDLAVRLAHHLASARATHRVALLHYSPVKDTLAGERLEIFPFLGSYLLSEAVDSAGADLVLHGHAHGGVEQGVTPGGIQVRNVAQPVIRSSFRVYCLDDPSHSSPDRRPGVGAAVGR